MLFEIDNADVQSLIIKEHSLGWFNITDNDLVVKLKYMHMIDDRQLLTNIESLLIHKSNIFETYYIKNDRVLLNNLEQNDLYWDFKSSHLLLVCLNVLLHHINNAIIVDDSLIIYIQQIIKNKEIKNKEIKSFLSWNIITSEIIGIFFRLYREFDKAELIEYVVDMGFDIDFAQSIFFPDDIMMQILLFVDGRIVQTIACINLQCYNLAYYLPRIIYPEEPVSEKPLHKIIEEKRIGKANINYNTAYGQMLYDIETNNIKSIDKYKKLINVRNLYNLCLHADKYGNNPYQILLYLIGLVDTSILSAKQRHKLIELVARHE